ncbi:HEAT repeat domain-containing protein [Streptomyces yokosukanensis]|uniref:HEAT repeat domain-containing protein n=1 Tax=Streptomyces yokosukanensis TaxID=67386 RepID=UPI00341FE407
MEQASSIADLIRMRMDGDVTGLCRATRSETHDVSLYATILLGSSTGPPEAVEALFACLRQRGEPHPGLRWQAAKALGKLRERRAVPELLRLLVEERHSREQLDRPACDALAAIGGPEAVSGLLDVLDQVTTDRPGYTAALVLDALARMRPPEAVTPLLALLWHHLPDHAERVVRTLGAIGDPRAGSALLVLAHAPASGTRLRRAAVTALHALPDAAWPPARRYPSAEPLLYEAQRDPDPETARLATALLSRTEDGRNHLLDVLRAASRSPHHPECPPHAVAAVCAHVAEAPDLFAVPDPGEYHALLRHHLRESAVPTVRRTAALALSAYAGAEAGEALLEALSDALISDAVADLIARLPGPPLQELLELLTGGDGTVTQQRGAARALGGIGHTGAAQALLTVLENGMAPTAVRTAAADALGALRRTEAAAPLAALAEDEEQPGTLRARAVRALGLIGAPALPVLVALADGVDNLSEDLSDRLVATLAARPEAGATAVLGRLAAAPPPRTATDAAVGQERLAASRPVREAASAALTERGTSECLTPLTSLLGPGSWSGAHEAAVRALLKIGTAEAHERVLAYCRTMTYLYDWHVEALDAVAEARAVRLGP